MTPWDELTAGAVLIEVREHLKERIARGDRLRVKLGVDPSAPDIHIGFTVVLRRLAAFQRLGHTAVLIIGDTTGQIGDPTGENAARPQLSLGQVRANAQTYTDQVFKILDRGSTEVRWQSEWFDRLRLPDIVKLASTHTAAQMLQREDFANRYRQRTPIALHEFLYPLLQGYDSVAVRADLELGGTDQTYNLLAGREIQRAYGQPPQDILTTPLLEGLDGSAKMSKSKGNYIGITEPPESIYGKTMRLPDPLIGKFFRLATDVDPGEVARREAAVKTGELNPRDWKAELARTLVRLYHGAEAVAPAERAFDRLVREHMAPESITEVVVPDLERSDLFQVLVTCGLASSTSDGRRLLRQGGVRVDGEVVRAADLRLRSGQVVQVGKLHYVRVVSAPQTGVKL
jgi:tyrosyl-tRNA synthetase